MKKMNKNLPDEKGISVLIIATEEKEILPRVRRYTLDFLIASFYRGAGYNTETRCCYNTKFSKNFVWEGLLYKPEYSKISKKNRIMVVFEEKNLANIDDFFGFKMQFVQKVIFADLTFKTPSCRNWSGNDFYNTKLKKLRFFYVFEV